MQPPGSTTSRKLSHHIFCAIRIAWSVTSELQFEQNRSATRLINVYNLSDKVFMLDTFESPWQFAQLNQKPHLFTFDNAVTQYWGALDNDNATEHVIWADPSIEVDERRYLTRQWNELAFWFSPLSGAAGQRELLQKTGTRTIVNINMTRVGGSDGGPLSYLSHRYPTAKPIWEVMPLYQALVSELMK